MEAINPMQRTGASAPVADFYRYAETDLDFHNSVL